MDVVCGEGTLVGFDLIYRRPDKTEERRGEERKGGQQLTSEPGWRVNTRQLQVYGRSGVVQGGGLQDYPGTTHCNNQGGN